MRPLGELGQVGPDRRDVWDGFERTETVTAYPMVENHDTEQRKRMVAGPDKYLAPLAKPRAGRKLKRVDQLWPKAGRLLVSERLWLETNRVIAMRSDAKVLSNVWWPVLLEDTSAEKALAVWLNSSLGLLTILAQRTTTRGGWVAMKKADLEQLPVLDTNRLSPSQLKAMADLFDELAEEEFERLPSMRECQTRRALDERPIPHPGSAGPQLAPHAARHRAGRLQPPPMNVSGSEGRDQSTISRRSWESRFQAMHTPPSPGTRSP